MLHYAYECFYVRYVNVYVSLVFHWLAVALCAAVVLLHQIVQVCMVLWLVSVCTCVCELVYVWVCVCMYIYVQCYYNAVALCSFFW